jgi:hypothetical protein
MKTKVSQKEWDDARDKFLCAIVTALAGVEGGWNITWAITEAATLTSELYEVEEKPVQQYEKAMFMGQEFDNLSRPIKAEDTRPFNPKVVEIFNEYLPKEIAPLAIEAHKKSIKYNSHFLIDSTSLKDALYDNLSWHSQNMELGNWSELWENTNGNTITATPEQLREWFPQAYENEGGEK